VRVWVSSSSFKVIVVDNVVGWLVGVVVVVGR